MISAELARLLDDAPLTPAQKARLYAVADNDPREERDIARLGAHLGAYFSATRAKLMDYLAEVAASKSMFAIPPMPASVQSSITAVLADTAIRAVIETWAGLGMDASGSGQIIAAGWASMHAAELVRQIDAHTQSAINAAVSDFASTPGMDIAAALERIPLDEARALNIATTEITRAYAIGQERAADDIYKLFPRQRIIKVWFTRHDDRVCPICSPLNKRKIGQDEQWTSDGLPVNDVFGVPLMAPPAHPNCRCRIQYRLALRGE